MKIKRIKKGFTLVELVVVIAVIAILGAVAVGAYFGITESANHSRVTSEIKELYNLLRLDIIANGEKENVTFEHTKNGFTSNRYYADDIKTLIEDATSREDYLYYAGTYDSSFTVSEQDQIYFFAVKNENIFDIKYLGYLSKSLDVKYAKYIDCFTGEIVDYPTIATYVVFENDEIYYDVTFFVNGSIYQEETIKQNELVSRPLDPELEGHNFLEWKCDGVSYDFSLPVTRDLEISAEFNLNSYNVEFVDEYNLSNSYITTIAYGTKISSIVPEGVNDPNYTFEAFTYEDGTSINEEDIVRSDIKLVAKYHKKRVVFNVEEGVTVYHIPNTARIALENNYIEVAYDKWFNQTYYEVSTETNYIQLGWEHKGKPVLRDSFQINCDGDYVITPKVLNFECEYSSSGVPTIISYKDTDPIINLADARYNNRRIGIKDPTKVFENFKQIKFFSGHSTSDYKGILKGQTELEELYPGFYTSEYNYKLKLEQIMDCTQDELSTCLPKLKTIYASPEYTYNDLMSYSYDGFAYNTSGLRVRVIIVSNRSNLCTAVVQGLGYITRVIDVKAFPTTITHINRGFLGYANKLDYFIIPKTVSQIQSESFSGAKFPIYHEWKKDEFSKQNLHNYSYLTGYKGTVYYEGEWAYDSDGEPYPLVEK